MNEIIGQVSRLLDEVGSFVFSSANFVAVVGIFVAIIGIFVAIVGARAAIISARETRRQRIGAEKANFPFDYFNVDDLLETEVLNRLQNFTITDANIHYIRRLPINQHQNLVDEWKEVLNRQENPRLLLKGVTGLGKTREAIELLKTMERELPADQALTILMPKSNLDVPQAPLPDDIPRQNLVLFINDLHLRYESGSQSGMERKSLPIRLQHIIDYFERRTHGYGTFRVIATVRSEPTQWARIDPNNPYWQTFTIVELPRLHSDQADTLIEAVTDKLEGISVDHDAKEIMAERNDGRFRSIIVYLGTENKNAVDNTVIDERRVRERFTGEYRKEWELYVYNPEIKGIPYRVHVLSALDILNAAQVPFIKEVVIELAARLWRSWQPLWWRRRRIQKDLPNQVWIEENKGQLLCPELYFENEGDLSAAIPAVVSTLLALTYKKRLRLLLFDSILNFGYRLQNHYYDREYALRVFARLVKLDPRSAKARERYAGSLADEGYLQQAQRELAQTILLDPSNPGYHMHYAGMASAQGKFYEAEPYYRTALRLLSRWDDQASWVLDAYASYQDRMGMTDKAIGYLEQFLEWRPEFTYAHVNLALRWIAKGDVEKATEHMNLAVQLNPEPSANTLHGLGITYRRLDYFREAIEFYSKSIEMVRSDAILSFNTFLGRAICYLQLEEQQLAQQDLAIAKKGASIAIKRCPNSYGDLYLLAFILLLQGDTKRATRTLRRAYGICSLPGVVSTYAAEARSLESIVPPLPGLGDFLAILQHPEETREPADLPAESKDESVGRLLERRDSLEEMRDEAARARMALGSETIEVLEEGVRVALTGTQTVKTLEIDAVNDARVIKAINTAIIQSRYEAVAKLGDIGESLIKVFSEFVSEEWNDVESDEDERDVGESQTLHISFPYVDGSIDKVSYLVRGGYCDVIIIPLEGFIFDEKDIVFTMSGDRPSLDEDQVREAERSALSKLIVSFPVKEYYLKAVSYDIADNYLHIGFRGNLGPFFDEGKIVFIRFTESKSERES